MSYSNYFERFASGKDSSLSAAMLRWILAPLSAAYASIPKIKEICYKAGILKSEKLPVPVISIGNLTWGGTGKTPAVITISGILKKHSIPHAVLSRGYGSRSNSDLPVAVADGKKLLARPPAVSDENYLIAKNLKNVPVIQGKNRCAGGRLAVGEFDSNCLVLDDGFQYLKMKRDLNILLWDSRILPDNAKPIPAGNMREFFSAARRADIIILTKTNQSEIPVEKCKEFFAGITQGKPVFHAVHEIDGIVEHDDEDRFLKDSELYGKKAVVFCGIAEPDSFRATAGETGISIVEHITFRDHHNYTDYDIGILRQALVTANADFLLTTEKDVCRNGELLKEAGTIIYPKITFRVIENDALEEMILKTVGAA